MDMCGYVYKADSDDSIKGKNVLSVDGSIIGTAVSSIGNILIIEAKFAQEGERTEEIRSYEIPLIEIEKVIGQSIILKSKKEYIQQAYLKNKVDKKYLSFLCNDICLIQC
jgi:hypothetical protein